MDHSGVDLVDLTQKFQKHYERMPSVTSDSETDETEASPILNINRHLCNLDEDFLYHISLGKKINNLEEMFGDIKFICMGGSPKRMHQFAMYIKDYIGYKLPAGQTFENISEPSDRYSMYKIGPVLSVNHGIGCPSISILLHELIKLVYYAKCKDVTFFRLGTCGGVGVKAGTVIVTDQAVDGMFRPEYRQIILGNEVIRSTQCDQELVNKLVEIGQSYQSSGELEGVISGKTMCANDFYEGQGRVDGAFCEYTSENKMKFLKQCKEVGIKNIEMESLCFTGLLSHAKIRAAVVCVALVDRLDGDQMTLSHEANIEYQQRPFKLVGEYIKQMLKNGRKTRKIMGKKI